MNRKIAIAGLLFLLAACARPAPATPTSTAPVTAAPPTLGLPTVAAPAFTSIRMSNEHDGWAITDAGVVRTNDGGASWHDVTPSGLTALGFGATFDFLDAAHGWILTGDPANSLTGTLYRTQDGGKSWKTIPVGFGSGFLQFSDASNGWMMAGLTVGAGEMGVAIFHSADGGLTWSQSYVNDPSQPGAASSLPYGGLKDGLTVQDAKNAWVGGIVYTPGVVYFYQTQDGGQTWKQPSLPLPTGYEQGQYETVGPQFVTAKDAYLPVHITSQNGVLLAVYYSHDAGLSWALAPKLVPNGGTLNFVSAADGFIWNGSQFYVTHDGAKTWTTVSPGIAFGDAFAGMDFVSAGTGFVLTNDVTGTRLLYKSTDGGLTWVALGK